MNSRTHSLSRLIKTRTKYNNALLGIIDQQQQHKNKNNNVDKPRSEFWSEVLCFQVQLKSETILKAESQEFFCR